MDECGFTGINRQNYKHYLSGFFNWAVRQKKTPFNPVAGTKKITTESHTPEIYTPSEVKKIMGEAVELHPALVPYFSIAFFAGVRPQEIVRLNWQDIDLELGEIHIRAGQSKTRSARIVCVAKNLKAWLQKYTKKEGPVFSHSASSLSRWRKEIYVKARVESIQDGARHTFATFHLALHSLYDTPQRLQVRGSLRHTEAPEHRYQPRGLATLASKNLEAKGVIEKLRF